MKFRMCLLTVLLIIVAFTATSFAEKSYDSALIDKIVYVEYEQPMIMLFSEQQPIEEYLAEQFAKHVDEVDLSQYDITLNEISVILSEHYEYMVVSGLKAFKVAEENKNDDNPIVESLMPKYIFSSPEEDEAGRTFIRNSVKEYTDYAKELTDDPVEQLLLVHDRILKNTKYDFNYNTVSYSAYGLFKNNTCVCQGYAEAMYMIAKELGIEGGFCSYRHRENESTFKGHIWNYFKIDNQWYQLDATWDDPDAAEKTAGLYDTSYHAYFLVSDAVIEEEHYSKDIWITSLDEKPNCYDTKYEKNHFFNISQCCEITYGDGYLQTSLKAGNTTIELRTYDGLYTGPVIVSKIGETANSYTMYYYFLEDLRSFDIMVKADENEILKGCKKYSKTVPDDYNFQYAVVSNTIPKTDFSKNQDLTMYIWDISTLKPFSQKVQLN